MPLNSNGTKPSAMPDIKIALRRERDRQCRCFSQEAVVGESEGSLSLLCAKCGKYREPLLDTAAEILAAVSEKFGPPAAVTIRDADQNNWKDK
jgi:hypothetical protein